MGGSRGRLGLTWWPREPAKMDLVPWGVGGTVLKPWGSVLAEADWTLGRVTVPDRARGPWEGGGQLRHLPNPEPIRLDAVSGCDTSSELPSS